MRRLAIAVASLMPLVAVGADSKRTFEVASVKPSTPVSIGDMHNYRILTGPRFGPGTEDATRWVCDNCSLGMLLASAYDLKRFQINGPKWIDSEKFDIAARVAPGATKEDLRAMQQNLLAERFGLKARLEKKEMQVYDLVVAKNPPKLTESSAAKPAGAPQSHEGHSGPSAVSTPARTGAMPAFGDRNAGRTFTMNMHGNTRHQAVAESMPELADVLAAQLEKPVTDSTGLTGKYDFMLTFTGGNGPDMAVLHGGAGGPAAGGHDAEPEAPPLQKALQDQLGLRLESKKGAAGVLIVEKIERVPSEN
jgi:uncharacterized protein (TIGR03435 family)